MHNWFINISRPCDKPQKQTEFVYCWDSEKNKSEFPKDLGTQYARQNIGLLPFENSKAVWENSVLASETSRQIRVLPRI